MKNIVKAIVCMAMALLFVWGVWSWWDVVRSNTPTSDRELSKYNFFVLLTDSQKEEEVAQQREAEAVIYTSTDNAIIFNTMADDELWELRVAEPADWNTDSHYVVVFDTMGTADTMDDRIMSVSVKSHG